MSPLHPGDLDAVIADRADHVKADLMAVSE
jgi:hypothetical protein